MWSWEILWFNGFIQIVYKNSLAFWSFGRCGLWILTNFSTIQFTDLPLESGNNAMTGQKPAGASKSRWRWWNYSPKLLKFLNDTFEIDLRDEDKVDFFKMKENVYQNENLMAFFNKTIQKQTFRTSSMKLLMMNFKLHRQQTVSLQQTHRRPRQQRIQTPLVQWNLW